MQLLLVIILIAYDIPEVLPQYPERKNDDLVWCSEEKATTLISHIYPFCLIIICTYYAVMTRGIPKNYKETRSIGLAMYSSCIIWPATVPLYFLTKSSDFQIRIHIYSLVVSLIALTILGCVFIPKLYILFFKPKENLQRELIQAIFGQKLAIKGVHKNFW